MVSSHSETKYCVANICTVFQLKILCLGATVCKPKQNVTRALGGATALSLCSSQSGGQMCAFGCVSAVKARFRVAAVSFSGVDTRLVDWLCSVQVVLFGVYTSCRTSLFSYIPMQSMCTFYIVHEWACLCCIECVYVCMLMSSPLRGSPSATYGCFYRLCIK